VLNFSRCRPFGSGCSGWRWARSAALAGRATFLGAAGTGFFRRKKMVVDVIVDLVQVRGRVLRFGPVRMESVDVVAIVELLDVHSVMGAVPVAIVLFLAF
jgi:hypothetical protein